MYALYLGQGRFEEATTVVESLERTDSSELNAIEFISEPLDLSGVDQWSIGEQQPPSSA